jgi:hypothetical protein
MHLPVFLNVAITVRCKKKIQVITSGKNSKPIHLKMIFAFISSNVFLMCFGG